MHLFVRSPFNLLTFTFFLKMIKTGPIFNNQRFHWNVTKPDKIISLQKVVTWLQCFHTNTICCAKSSDFSDWNPILLATNIRLNPCWNGNRLLTGFALKSQEKRKYLFYSIPHRQDSIPYFRWSRCILCRMKAKWLEKSFQFSKRTYRFHLVLSKLL